MVDRATHLRWDNRRVALPTSEGGHGARRGWWAMPTLLRRPGLSGYPWIGIGWTKFEFYHVLKTQ